MADVGAGERRSTSLAWRFQILKRSSRVRSRQWQGRDEAGRAVGAG